MGRYQPILTAVLALCAAKASAQSTDWLAFFHDQLSADAAVSNAARKNISDALNMALHGDVGPLQKDLAGVIPAFDDKDERVRISASGLCAVLSQFREDGEQGLKLVIPGLLSLVRDPNPKVRENVFAALMYLRPKIPPEVLPVLREFATIPDPRIQGRAIYGIARSFTPGSADDKLLQSLLSSTEPQTRSSAAQGVGMARVQEPNIIEKLRELLSDPDRGVVREAIRALDSIGPAARSATADLQRIADSGADQELSQAAAGAIRRIEALPPPR